MSATFVRHFHAFAVWLEGDPRRLWRRYAVALGLIVLLLCMSHGAAILSNHAANTDAALINMSGRQRMLSQRILLLSTLMKLDNQTADATRTPFEQAVALFEKSHSALVKGDPSRGLPGLDTGPLKEHYFGTGTGDGLDGQVRHFLAATEQFASGSAGAHAAWDHLIKDGMGPLLTNLDRAVTLFEERAKARLDVLRSIEILTFLAALLTLALEGILIFLPAQRTVVQAIERLETQNHHLALAKDRLRRYAKAAREAHRAKRAADTDNTRKSLFLANMSHEMRTPLNGMLGMAQLLESETLDARCKAFVGIIRTSGQILLDLINDILDLSRMEEGRIDLEAAPFDVNTLLIQVRDTLMGIALQKGVALDIACDIDGSGHFVGDAARLKQVLINLAGNALKFTNDGQVVVSATQDADGRLQFSVSDTGPGISEDHQKRIFDRFFQVDESETRSHGGSGLGLTIAHKLVTLMGGRIGVESTVGHGSLFWFTIPLIEAAPGTPQSDGKTEAPDTEAWIQRQAQPMARVLVAEDNAVNRTLIGHVLDALDGIDYVFAENGVQAITLLDETPYDLVLMDIQMPVMGGEEAIRRIRTTEGRHQAVPIIVLTANAFPEMHESYHALGADACLTKPLDVSACMTLIRQFTSASANQADGADAATTATATVTAAGSPAG